MLLRCLSPDPAARPASAADVARALPGGDPLAAAIAAGETPSPEMIAEAAEEDPAGARKAWTYLAVFAVCVLAVISLAPQYSLIRRVPIEKPPAVLVDRAREMAVQLGWTSPPRDEWSVLLSDSRQAPWLGEQFGRDSVTAHLLRSRGGSLRLVYRRAAAVMRPLNAEAMSPGMDDPPLVQPGRPRLELDGSGRLSQLFGVAADHDSTAPPVRPSDPALLFALAGLDTARFTPVGAGPDAVHVRRRAPRLDRTRAGRHGDRVARRRRRGIAGCPCCSGSSSRGCRCRRSLARRGAPRSRCRGSSGS